MLRPSFLRVLSPLRSVPRTPALPLGNIQGPFRLRSRLPILLSPSPRRRSFMSSPYRWSADKPDNPRNEPSSPLSPPPPPPDTAAKTEDPIPVQNTVPPVPLWQRLGPLTTGANAYARAQKRRPWTTQFVSAVVIYLIADLSAQSIGSDEYDPKRTVRNLIIGGVSAIPSYLWFNFLSHNFNYSSRILSLGTKILINLAFFTPLFNTYFFGAQALLSGCSVSAIVDRIMYAVPPSTLNSWKFWPWVTAFSFTFVPIQYRAVFAGIISIGWQTYLAWLNRRAELAATLAARQQGAGEVKEDVERVIAAADVE